jgi:exonuclease III
MKLVSWNVNGLRACYQKGFCDSFEQLDADFFCLQETKMQEGQLDLAFLGYQSYWNYAEKKGYSGTAVFTKHSPQNVTYGIGIEEHDHEGRVITLEMPDFYLVTVYTPNSQDGLKRLDYRMRWEHDFQNYLKKLDEKKPVIVCGDMNDVPTSRAYRLLVGDDLIDAWKDVGRGYAYTYNRHHLPFRIDHVFYRGGIRAITAERLKGGSSDHYPLMVTFDIDITEK